MPRPDTYRLRLARRFALIAGLAATAVAAAPGQVVAAPPASCTKVAAVTGSDSNPGTPDAPFASVQHLVDELDSGQTGCLRSGSYGGGDVRMHNPDTALQSYPGERARLTSFLEVYPSATNARVSGLFIDTTGDPGDVGTKLQADGTVFSDNVVTKGGEGICVLAGSMQHANGIVIERNRVLNCSSARKPDGTPNKWDHALYLEGTRNAVVRWNLLSGNAGGWGVHMYPDADGTLVEHNIIDSNEGGVIFAGADGATSDDNTVRNNAITYSGARWNVEGSWSGGPSGRGNQAADNCLYSRGQNQPSGLAQREGFAASANAVLNGSPYVSPSRGDYHFKASSPCAAMVGDVAGKLGLPSYPDTDLPPLTVIIRANPASSAATAPAVRTKVTGKVIARKTVSRKKKIRVAVQVKGKKGWRTVARRTVRRGRFSARLRLRRTGHGRTARIRAVVPGKAHSRAVRVRVAR